MTREELLRILTFADKTRSISQKMTALSEVDAHWNIISFAMRRHLEGKLLTITSAAAAAEVPYGTAMRRVKELIDGGYLIRRVRTKTGKSFSLHPTRKMIEDIENYAMHLKGVVGDTFGFNPGDNASDDFFFGGSYMGSRILPYPNAMRTAIGQNRIMRILCPSDPVFHTLQELVPKLQELCGTQIEIIILPLDDLHQEILKNAKRSKSQYDLVAIDLPWVGELADKKAILPIDDLIESAGYNPSDFHNTAYKGSSWSGAQFGLPIQPTVELLFCRRDLFFKAGLPIPETIYQVSSAARMLHRTALNLSGIVMNFGRGTPVAHTFIHTLADFGRPIINLDALGDDFDIESIEGHNFRPQIDTEEGRETANFLCELRSFVHPESMVCDWDRRIKIFTAGQAAMTYGWSVRAAKFESEISSPAQGNVTYVPHPSVKKGKSVTPIGGFFFALPAGLTSERQNKSWKMLEYLTRPEMMKWYVQNGNITSPRFSTSADPEVLSKNALIGQIDLLERQGGLQTWPRPPVPEFSDILRILGNHIHMMLQGETSISAALTQSQNEIDRLMRTNGRY
jgi:multiple sugar transport system substrate-binding protein|tara:strand:- start:1473 stop:3176 length:1704 start_codon:yes stop_codon:yes gene_type:complete